MSEAVVLIVDDMPKNLQTLGETLEAQGYQVIAAVDGKQALEILNREPVDLILLDVLMPELDGFEICQHIKNDPRLALIPIIFLTARAEQDDVIKGLQMGAVDYVTKPFNLTELSARVRTHIELKLSRDRIHRQNQELEAVNAELQQTVELKNKVLSIAAHDLRNPLTSVIAGSDLLLRLETVRKEQRVVSLVENMRTSANRMNMLINEVLEAAALQMGKMDVHCSELNICSFVRAAAQQHQAAMEAKQQQLVFESPQGEFSISADPLKFYQVVDNLMSNAVKYSPSGTTILVRVERSAATATALITVQDEGLGFSEEDKQKAFTMFQRLSARPTGGEPSTGIGLAIVKHIVHLHGGIIRLESRRDEGIPGSTFVVELPLIRS